MIIQTMLLAARESLTCASRFVGVNEVGVLLLLAVTVTEAVHDAILMSQRNTVTHSVALGFPLIILSVEALA